MSKPVAVHCTYRLKPGKEDEFVGLLEKHWPTLRKAGLATVEPPRILRAKSREGKVVFYEMFSWIDENAPRVAHETPAVMQVWEPMGALCDDMEFNDYEPVKLSFA
jgi:hypothetical protein